MIQIYKKSSKKNKSLRLSELNKPVSGCWVNVVAPTSEEISILEKKFNIPSYIVENILDPDSMPRLEKEAEKGLSLLMLRVPFRAEGFSTVTLPFGMVVLSKKNYFVTICSEKVGPVEKIIFKSQNGFCTDNKAIFFNMLLKNVIKSYMKELNFIEHEINEAEVSIRDSFQNKEIIQLLSLQKTLVYFRTGVVGNRTVLNKIFSSRLFSLNDDEKELLEDSIVDMNEAYQLVEIYAQIIVNTMSAYTSIVSNNFNTILRFLALVTVAISIPTMVASFYGMNIALPLQGTEYSFLVVISIALIATLAVLVAFKYKKLI